jgi:integrase
MSLNYDIAGVCASPEDGGRMRFHAVSGSMMGLPALRKETVVTRTRTPGITIDAYGRRTIDKEHRGVRLFLRLGNVLQEQAEQRLRAEIDRLEAERSRRAPGRPLFSDCAARYLVESRNKRSVEVIRWHVALLLKHFAHLEPHKIHDGTLAPFVAQRLAEGASATTVNRSLEVVRTILNRAARAYRDADGRPWLDGVLPPLITMLPESGRAPYPITWDEQDRLFQRLPARLARMALFAVHTGLRDSNVCRLEWAWEVPVPEVGRSVFVIPPEAFKAKRSHVVILNDVAWSIVQTQRGMDPIWVFAYRGRPLGTLNNTAWQAARKAVGLPLVRVHDLRHTYASRLRAAGVPEEDRAALLGHATRSMPAHYASADVGRLQAMANRVLERRGTRTILRVASG